jgi:hypothetical protein
MMCFPSPTQFSNSDNYDDTFRTAVTVPVEKYTRTSATRFHLVLLILVIGIIHRFSIVQNFNGVRFTF